MHTLPDHEPEKEDMSLILDRPAVTSDLRFHPTTALIAADLAGIDLREEIDTATVARLRQAILKYKILFFRDQAIEDDRQIHFTRYFGAITPAHPVTNGLEERPEIRVDGQRKFRPMRLAQVLYLTHKQLTPHHAHKRYLSGLSHSLAIGCHKPLLQKVSINKTLDKMIFPPA